MFDSFDQLDFTAFPALSAAQVTLINDQTDELELEEIIAMVESGIDEEEQPLSEKRIAELEQRILHLDSLIRRKKKAIANDKDR